MKCLAVEPLQPVQEWLTVRGEWWFDSEILGVDLAPVEDYFATLDQYSDLPHTRGSGFLTERWVRSRNIEHLHQQARIALDAALKGV
jgi:hypothetical protein